MHDKAVRKMEKWLNLQIHEIMTDKIAKVDTVVIGLKNKEIYGHITQVYENDKPISASAGWPTHCRRRSSMLMLNLQEVHISQISSLCDNLTTTTKNF